MNLFSFNFSKCVFASAFALSLLLGNIQFSYAGDAEFDEAVSKVITKMESGDVAAACSGGIPTIVEASSTATRSLAMSGQISGDFQAIGKAAGAKFAQKNCG